MKPQANPDIPGIPSPAPLFGETSSWLLWPEESPGSAGVPDFTLQGPAATPPPDVIDVERPRVFHFAPREANGVAVMVLAGGGYTKLVASYEGIDVAHWLNSLGIHAFLLIHRFPSSRWATGGRSGSQAPVDDAIECMRQIRARAENLGISPNRLGVLGLSSGGHLAACLASRYPPGWSPPRSNYQQCGRRPDFLIVGYAPISTNAAGRTVIPDKPPLPPPEKQALYEALQPDAHLLDDPPPTFLVYSAEDPVVPVDNAWRLAAAVRAKGGRVECHVYARGAHGFALREKDLPIAAWLQACAAWLRTV